MKLNPDCVRSVLLEVEKTKIYERLSYDDLCGTLPDYDPDDVRYTILKLKEAGLLQAITAVDNSHALPIVVEICDITYAGHEFLNNVRSDTNWGKVKDIAKKVGAFSIKALGEIAKIVLSAAITAALSQNQ